MTGKAILYSSKAVWISGSLLFLYQSLPDIWGTLKFIFFSFNGLFSDLKPDEMSRAEALRTLISFISALLFCLILQVLIFAFPFVLTQSQSLVQYYADREKRYIKALSGRLDLAQKLTEIDLQLSETIRKIKALQNEVYTGRQQVQYLSAECAELIQAVTVARQTLAQQTSQHSKLNSKGDF